MSKKLPWNYNMDEAPKDGTEVFVSNGSGLWIAYNSGGYWWCLEGMISYKLIAWAEIDLPERGCNGKEQVTE